MRVTVIIPCHNDGAFLPDAIASLRDQEQHELVVVDSASTDPETLTLLSALERAGVQVERVREPGVCAARTRGLRSTTAPYVLPLDADDELCPGVLKELADSLDREPSVGAAWGDIEAFGAYSGVFPTWPTLDPFLLTRVNRMPNSSLYRREAIEAAGGWTLELGYEDWDLWLSIAEQGRKGVHIGRPHARYRQHATPRRLAADRSRHGDLVAALAARHPAAFANARAFTHGRTQPRALRLALAASGRVPGVSVTRRHRLDDVLMRTLVPTMRAVVDGHREASPLSIAARRVAAGLRGRLARRG
jgi:glycosyltransferase involved in cell wall biosynthesis